MEPFFRDPGLETSIRQLSRDTDISPAWVSKNTKELNDQDILNVEEDLASKKISIGKKFRDIKEIYNYRAIKDSGLVEYLEEELRPDAIVLFGSFERGEDTKNSDIDIAIINGRKKNLNLSDFEEKLLDRNIEIQSIENLKNSDINFRNSLANGKTLYGFMEVV